VGPVEPEDRCSLVTDEFVPSGDSTAERDSGPDEPPSNRRGERENAAPEGDGGERERNLNEEADERDRRQMDGGGGGS
jgi:hypothetical protein